MGMIRKYLAAGLVLAAALIAIAPPAYAAYANGETVYSSTLNLNGGTTTMSNFKVSDSRPYDLNGQLLTGCAPVNQKWGFKVDEVKNLLPDPTIIKVNWDSPVNRCTAVGGRRNLNAGADAYHFVAKVTLSGSNFKGYVIAR
jgi:hypothetical protein